MDWPDAAEDGLHSAGVRDLQRLVFVVPESEKHDDVLRIELALLERVVEQGKHRSGWKLLLRGGAHDAADQRGEERGGRGFAADIAEHDGGLIGLYSRKS